MLADDDVVEECHHQSPVQRTSVSQPLSKPVYHPSDDIE